MSVVPIPASQYYSSLSAASKSPAASVSAVASSAVGAKAAVTSSSIVKPVYGASGAAGNGTVSFAPTGGAGSGTSAAPVVHFTGAASKVGSTAGVGFGLLACLWVVI